MDCLYLENKVLSKLGNPSISPYGFPIPGSNYVINKKAIRLSQLDSGSNLLIDRIPEDDESLLKYLVENNVVPGQSGMLKTINKSTKTISITCSSKEAFFGFEVGTLIWVIPS